MADALDTMADAARKMGQLADEIGDIDASKASVEFAKKIAGFAHGLGSSGSLKEGLGGILEGLAQDQSIEAAQQMGNAIAGESQEGRQLVDVAFLFLDAGMKLLNWQSWMATEFGPVGALTIGNQEGIVPF